MSALGHSATNQGAPGTTGLGPGAPTSPAKEIIRAGKYTPLHAPAQILVPQHRREEKPHEWLRRVSAPGGIVHKALQMERATAKQRLAYLARKYRNYQPNKKSEHRLRAVMDARTYFRWKQTDPHFFDDDKNLKNFLRDNPECEAWNRA